MRRKIALDLYCGAGGAAKGYADAGFEVVGVDINPQPHYPFPFIKYDALKALEHWLKGNEFYYWAGKNDCRTVALDEIDFIHASPPCQTYSKMTLCRPGLAEKYPDLIAPTRELLKKTRKPYIIENVPGSPLENPLILCGCHFNMTTTWKNYGRVGLKRPRWFESNVPLKPMGPHKHGYIAVPVYGHGPSGHSKLRGEGFADLRREVMGIDWMNREELAESVPPKFTEYIGKQILSYLND